VHVNASVCSRRFVILCHLFQATLENVNTLKAAVENIRPEGYANLTHAFTKAFRLLEKVRQYFKHDHPAQ
jgi:hypothetical protein